MFDSERAIRKSIGVYSIFEVFRLVVHPPSQGA